MFKTSEAKCHCMHGVICNPCYEACVAVERRAVLLRVAGELRAEAPLHITDETRTLFRLAAKYEREAAGVK